MLMPEIDFEDDSDEMVYVRRMGISVLNNPQKHRKDPKFKQDRNFPAHKKNQPRRRKIRR